MGQYGIGDFYPLFGAHQLIGRKRDGKAVQQVIANVAFFGVVGSDQQRSTGVAEAEAFPFHTILATANGRQHQIHDAVIEKIQFIYVQHPPVRIGQEARLKHSTATRERRGYINGPHETVFGNPEGDLHKRCRNHLGGGIA